MGFNFLTDTWRHKTKLNYQYGQQMAENDELQYLQRQMDLYLDFNTYEEMIDYGLIPNYAKDSETSGVLEKHLTEVDITDYSGNYHTPTPSEPIEADFSTYKFGNASCRFNGRRTSISFPDSDDWDIMGTVGEEYTISLWVYQMDNSKDNHYVCQYEDSDTYWVLFWDTSVSKVVFKVYDTSSLVEMSGGSITENTWTHIAVVKKNGGGTDIWGLYINGEQVAYATSTTTKTLDGELYIGSIQEGSKYFYGNMDELIITAENLYSANPQSDNSDTITIPTSEHSANSNTKLLLHFNKASKFSDYSKKSLLATTAGSLWQIALSGSYQEGTLSFWVKNVKASTTLVDFSFGLKVYTNSSGCVVADLFLTNEASQEDFLYLEDGSDTLGLEDGGGLLLETTSGSANTISINSSTDVCDGDWHLITVVWRAKNDGSDKLSVYVDGDLKNEAINGNYYICGGTEKGTFWLGHGEYRPTWTKEELMETLPSSNGWAYNGTDEDRYCSVENGILTIDTTIGYIDIDNFEYSTDTEVQETYIGSSRVQHECYAHWTFEQDEATSEVDLKHNINLTFANNRNRVAGKTGSYAIELSSSKQDYLYGGVV